ncbi:MAG: hypothetical protein WCL14_13850 [Bacteroidota bacterium]
MTKQPAMEHSPDMPRLILPLRRPRCLAADNRWLAGSTMIREQLIGSKKEKY